MALELLQNAPFVELMEEPPENVWVWRYPNGKLSSQGLWGRCAVSAAGIFASVRSRLNERTMGGVPVKDGKPEEVRYADLMGMAFADGKARGFILYDDEGKEIKKWTVR